MQSSPSAVLPNAVREQAWRLLWQRLLQPIPDDPEPESDDDEEAADAA